MYKTLILDRDGVINHVCSNYVKSISELSIIPSSIKAINFAIRHELEVVVASNQAGIGKKLFEEDVLIKINNEINKKLIKNIEFYYCKHTAEDNCACRKPKPGLLNKIINETNPPHIFIGDNYTDIMAAKAACIDAALVLTGHGQRFSNIIPKNIPIYKNLECFINSIFKA